MISGKNYRKNSKNSRKFRYSLITVNFTVVFPEKFYPCINEEYRAAIFVCYSVSWLLYVSDRVETDPTIINGLNALRD